MTGPEVVAGLDPVKPVKTGGKIGPVFVVTIAVLVIGVLTVVAMGNEISDQANGRD